MRKRIFLICLFLLLVLAVWTVADYFTAATPVKAEFVNLSSLLTKKTLTERDYALLFEQTGLGRAAVDDLKAEADFAEQIKNFQNQQFAKLQYDQQFIFFPTTTAEVLHEAGEARMLTLPPLKAGDILITRSTKTLLYRHGHAALVLNENGATLESLMIGSDSEVLSADIWLAYPTLMVLRPKNVSQDTIESVVRFGQEKMLGVPYDLLTGVGQKDKTEQEMPDGTQCAHLVWQCYKQAGVELDSDGGWLVSPKDIAQSSELEVVFAYGFGEKGAW